MVVIPVDQPSVSPDDHESCYLWAVLICIFATAITSLGLVLQKYSLTLNEQSQKAVVYYRQPWWLAGLFFFGAGQFVNLIPMTTAPQVMLSCLGATALAFNAILAWIILGEQIHMLEVAAMIGMVCGLVMVVCTTPRDPAEEFGTDLSLDQIVGPLFSARFLSVTVCIFVLMFSLRLTVDPNSSLGLRWPELDSIMWTLCAAVASGYTVNLFKAIAELCGVWSKVRPPVHFQCYVLLLTANLLGVFQIHSLNRALNMGRAMTVVPTYCAFGLLSQLFLSELIVVCIPDTTAQLVVFVSGIFFIVLFIVLLARAKIASEEEPDLAFEEVMGKTMNLASVTSLRSAWKLPSGDLDFDESSALVRRSQCLSTWDCSAYTESFAGFERKYTVSVIGLGIA